MVQSLNNSVKQPTRIQRQPQEEIKAEQVNINNNTEINKGLDSRWREIDSDKEINLSPGINIVWFLPIRKVKFIS